MTYQIVAVVFNESTNHQILLASNLASEPTPAQVKGYADTFRNELNSLSIQPFSNKPSQNPELGQSDIYIKKDKVLSFYVFSNPEEV